MQRQLCVAESWRNPSPFGARTSQDHCHAAGAGGVSNHLEGQHCSTAAQQLETLAGHKGGPLQACLMAAACSGPSDRPSCLQLLAGTEEGTCL